LLSYNPERIVRQLDETVAEVLVFEGVYSKIQATKSFKVKMAL
jgi:hypothetical protein